MAANEPYVAPIDSTKWRVNECVLMDKICTKPEIAVQHLIVEHVETKFLMRCFNAHMPTGAATAQRKETCVLKTCTVATEVVGSGVAQPTASMPWVIAGDLNIDEGTMMKWCQPFVKKNVPCMSVSGWPKDKDPQKSDHALSQGIALMPVKSWVGWHSQPCASDIHDAVVVMGTLDLEQLEAQPTSSSWAIDVWRVVGSES